jgi:hypothetical protein
MASPTPQVSPPPGKGEVPGPDGPPPATSSYGAPGSFKVAPLPPQAPSVRRNGSVGGRGVPASPPHGPVATSPSVSAPSHVRFMAESHGPASGALPLPSEGATQLQVSSWLGLTAGRNGSFGSRPNSVRVSPLRPAVAAAASGEQRAGGSANGSRLASPRAGGVAARERRGSAWEASGPPSGSEGPGGGGAAADGAGSASLRSAPRVATDEGAQEQR